MSADKRKPYRGHKAGFGRSCLPLLLIMFLTVAALGHVIARVIT